VIRELYNIDDLYCCCITVLFAVNFYTCFKILERAERLREIDSNLLPAFVRLQELVIIA